MSEIQQETISQTETMEDAAVETSNEVVVETTNAHEEEKTTTSEEVVKNTAEEKTEAHSFLDSLTEELRENKALKNFKDVEGLAKSYVHLNQLLGKKFENMSPEELDSYYTKLGRPEDSEGYKMPDSMAPELGGWYKETAFKLGLTQDQARGLAESYMDIEQNIQKEQISQMEAQQEQWEASLKEEFGTAFEKRIEIAKKALRSYGGEELVNFLNETKLGSHPELVKAFAKIGKDMQEDSLTQSEASANFGVTPQEAKQKIAHLKRDPDFMKSYRSATAPGHREAVQEMRNLYEIAFPSSG